MAKVSAYFSDVFGRSPFPALQQHASVCVQAVEVLLELVPAANAEQWDAVERCYQSLTEYEHQADTKKRQIRSHLPRGFFLPVARADLLDLLSRQDEIANGARDVGGLMLGRRMTYPSAVQAGVEELVRTTVESCAKMGELVSTFDELLDSGFSGIEVDRVTEMIEEVEDLEARTDEMVVQIRARLFEQEDQLPAVQAIFIYRVLDGIAELANHAEKVAHRVQMMVAK